MLLETLRTKKRESSKKEIDSGLPSEASCSKMFYVKRGRMQKLSALELSLHRLRQFVLRGEKISRKESIEDFCLKHLKLRNEKVPRKKLIPNIIF